MKVKKTLITLSLIMTALLHFSSYLLYIRYGVELSVFLSAWLMLLALLTIPFVQLKTMNSINSDFFYKSWPAKNKIMILVLVIYTAMIFQSSIYLLGDESIEEKSFGYVRYSRASYIGEAAFQDFKIYRQRVTRMITAMLMPIFYVIYNLEKWNKK
ncbi:hypothetical protein EC844_10939 [Acinetobacter calcoaceticus]|uniref:Uncharacterized protein n=1 Tax=Acinetobacter calcoaceticus TaxID=471 RepID=A0A4R1XXE0_ACICA|nr:hypothetical protein EC844_10939 [Acinetobacter calcoaceticus]